MQVSRCFASEHSLLLFEVGLFYISELKSFPISIKIMIMGLIIFSKSSKASIFWVKKNRMILKALSILLSFNHGDKWRILKSNQNYFYQGGGLIIRST